MFSSVSVSLSIFAYKSIRVQQTNINDQVGGLGPLKSIFAIQFKCTTRIHDKTKLSQGKYSIDKLLLKILQGAMYFSSPTWPSRGAETRGGWGDISPNNLTMV